MNLPPRPAREMAEKSPACLGPAQAVASPWSCDLPLTDTVLKRTRMLSSPLLHVWVLRTDEIFSVAKTGRLQFQGRKYDTYPTIFRLWTKNSRRPVGHSTLSRTLGSCSGGIWISVHIVARDIREDRGMPQNKLGPVNSAIPSAICLIAR